MAVEQVSEKPFVLLKTGPQCWYAMEVATRNIGVGFKTKNQAQATVDKKNARRGF